MAAVRAIIPVVSHHEIVSRRHDLPSVIFVAPEVERDVLVADRHLVHEDVSIVDPDGVALFSDDPLDK